MARTTTFCFLLLLTAGFMPQYCYASTVDTAKLSCLEKAGRLLDEALTILQKRYYKKDSVAWDQLRTDAKARLEAAGDCENAYAIIDWCFGQIRETHSFIMPPAKAAVYNYDTARLATAPSLNRLVGEIKKEIIDHSIGYITIPWINTTDEAICMRLADSLQQIVAGMEQQGISKWIIDLRANKGGNCWPMLAGIGSLLGNGVCGYFVSGAEKIPITYRNGAVYQGSQLRCRVSNACRNTRTTRPWIVVLTGPQTSSSGELVALAFKGREQVYLYGEPTAGFTTANTTFTLSDRSMLVVTVCHEADRTGKIQEGKIIPDEMIAPGPPNRDEDIPKASAVMWLQSTGL